MSKANNPIKVLNTALKRVSKGWVRGQWVTQEDGQTSVCLEGAIFGYCNAAKHGVTAAQWKAIDVVQGVITERYPKYHTIPSFNDDRDRTKDEVMEVIKLGIIRLETEDI